MRTEILIPASQRVVTAQEVRDYLKFGSDSEDTTINSFIDTATEAVEAYTGRTLVETAYQSWSHTVDVQLDIPRWPLISITSSFDEYSNVSEYEVFGDKIEFGVPSVIIYKAGYLRPATASGETVTLTAHGYSDGDQVVIDGTVYTVSGATTDTFVATGLPDGSVLVGVIPERLKMAVRKHAATQYLKGADQELSMEIKKEIKKLRRNVAFI